MTKKQKQLLLDAWQYCDDEDKSTEFMLQYMADMSGVEYMDVVEYLAADESDVDRAEYYFNNCRVL